MKKNGFTLVEIIISIAILSFVSAIILKLFISADGINQRAKDKSFASIYCSKAIESHRADKVDSAVVYNYYYDENWHEIDNPSMAYYSVVLKMTPSTQNSALIDIQSEVQDKNGALLLRHELTTLSRHSEVLVW
ncbi:MAG: hypothetical protein CSB19_01950 [Clostridiales bacterium]|nr:MAG: hypothetical protein CSB19_01950 [Clostridiales bacterium]